jgi:hypothetical protein
MKTSYSFKSCVSCIVVLTLIISFAVLCKDSFAINPFSIEADTLQGVVINPPDANGRFGQSVSDAGDVNGDGFDDIIIGAVGYPYLIGKAFIYFGGPTIETNPDVILSNGEYHFGGSVSKAGDVNGDGYDDVVTGVGHYVFNINGQVYIYFGGQNMNSTPDVVIPQGGKSVSNAGDVNGDGFSDVITAGGYIYFGGNVMDSIPDVIVGGYPVSNAGDVNNDGFDDVIVATAWPIAHIFLGGVNMDSVPDLIINTGVELYDFQVSDAGDVNGDGFDDVMCGNHNAGPWSVGKIFIYFGGQSMDNIADVVLTGQREGLYSGEHLGYRIASIGDLNEDGYSDILAGSWLANRVNSYVFFGGPSMDSIPEAVMQGTGISPPDMWVSSAGDFDGDGFPEMLVGIGASNYPTGVATLYDMNPVPPVPFCGPGPHFIDFCSSGIDSLDIAHNCETKAMIRMSLDTSDNCNVPSMPLPVFTGPTIVRRSNPKDTSGRFPGVAQLDGHNDIIETEFVSMDLRAFVASNGDTAFLRIIAGQGNAVGTCGTSLRPTFGYIHESPLYNYSAESFFDVFLELCIEDPNGIIGPPNPRYYLYNQEPVRMRATIDQIPPKCGIDPNTNEYYTVYMPDQNTCAKLYASCIPGISNPPIAKVVHVEHALPVELVSFTATQNGNNVDLTWTTSGENNNYGFSVERNSSSVWNEIGFVAGKGTVNTPSHYEFTDRKLSSGILRYRLKQIDFNGNFEYFDLSEAVTIGVPDKFFLEQNYPNPFNPVTTIAYGIPQAGNVKLKVFDMSGREIKTLINEFKDAGYYTAKFDASGLASGAYIYRIESGNYVSVKKMILIK